MKHNHSCLFKTFLFVSTFFGILFFLINPAAAAEESDIENVRSKNLKPAFIEAAKSNEFGFGFNAGYFKPTNDVSSFEDVYGGAGLTYEGKFFQRLNNGFGWEARVGYFKKSGNLVTGPPRGGSLNPTRVGTDYTMIPITFSVQIDLAKLGWMDPIYLGSFWGGFGTITPFIEAGGGMYLISETTDNHPELDTDQQSKFGYHVGAGVEFRQLHPYKFFFRMDWNSISGLAGDGGATRIYEEKDLGGLFIVFGLDIDFARFSNK